MEKASPHPTEPTTSPEYSGWQCCFCGERILEHISAEIAIDHAGEGVQGLRAHVRCLKGRLPSSVPFLDAEDDATSTA
jgi:hypothetical protein